MIRQGIDKNLSVGKVLMEEDMDARVLQMWSKKELNADRFYQTGFETILFNQSKDFALETVLSSVVPWDKELLILNSLDTPIEPRGVGIHPETLSHNITLCDLGSMELLVQSRPRLSYILLNIPDVQTLADNVLKQLLQIISRNKLTLIVNCDLEVTALNDRFMGAIDFMVGKLHKLRSFVVARRSKLVATEGNSRKLNMDLHAYWQLSLSKRNAFLEPMVS